MVSMSALTPAACPLPVQDPNLTEEEPTEEERPFLRAGWFRGPRSAVVFVYRAMVAMLRSQKKSGENHQLLGKSTLNGRCLMCYSRLPDS